MIGLLGRKLGMTRVFTEEGNSIAVSVVEITPNRVSQIKTLDNDGYIAVQLTAGHKKSSRVTKPMAGHYLKSKIEAGDIVSEFRINNESEYQCGQEISVSDVFNIGEYVDVTAVSKGKGFAGTVKRHNFRTQDATHGNSLSHRVPGSIGQNQTPGRVFKGKKMAGQMGNKQCTVQSLEIISVNTDKNLILIKGAIPGFPGSKVAVKPAVKKQSGSK